MSNTAIARIGVNRASSFIGVATFVSVVAGAIRIQERFSVFQIIGAVVIIIGVNIADFKRRHTISKSKLNQTETKS